MVPDGPARGSLVIHDRRKSVNRGWDDPATSELQARRDVVNVLPECSRHHVPRTKSERLPPRESDVSTWSRRAAYSSVATAMPPLAVCSYTRYEVLNRSPASRASASNWS